MSLSLPPARRPTGATPWLMAGGAWLVLALAWTWSVVEASRARDAHHAVTTLSQRVSDLLQDVAHAQKESPNDHLRLLTEIQQTAELLHQLQADTRLSPGLRAFAGENAPQLLDHTTSDVDAETWPALVVTLVETERRVNTERARHRAALERMQSRIFWLGLVAGLCSLAALIVGLLARDRHQALVGGLRNDVERLTGETQGIPPLRERLDRLELVEEVRTDGRWDWDLGTDTFRLSPAWWRRLGLGGEASDGRIQAWLGRVHPKDIGRLKGELDGLREGRVGGIEVEHRLLGEDGAWLTLIARARAARDASGRAVRLSGTLTDVSRLHQLIEIRDNFIAIVSHELRTPLTSIRGSLDLLLGGVVGELPTTAQEMLQLARKNSDRLLRLVNDLLDVERIESGLMRFEIRPVPLRPLVVASIDALRGFVADVDVRLSIGGPGEAPSPGGDPATGPAEIQVAADADRLVQVLVNLLSNAAKHAPPGTAVEVNVSRNDGWVRVAVTDRGPGIPPDFRDRVFDRFSQADTATNRNVSGTGLGLAIAHAITTRLEGRIDFVSEPGRTTFFLELREIW